MVLRWAVKLMMNSAVLIPLLIWFTDPPIRQIVFAIIVLAVVSFFIGDQWILRHSNNTVATIADFGLTGIYFWLVGYWYQWDLSAMELIVVAAIVSLVEAMFHHVLKRWDKQNNVFSMEPNRK